MTRVAQAREKWGGSPRNARKQTTGSKNRMLLRRQTGAGGCGRGGVCRKAGSFELRCRNCGDRDPVVLERLVIGRVDTLDRVQAVRILRPVRRWSPPHAALEVDTVDTESTSRPLPRSPEFCGFAGVLAVSGAGRKKKSAFAFGAAIGRE